MTIVLDRLLNPQRVQRRRTKGSHLPPNTKCVTRGTRWGNPFLPGSKSREDRQAVVAQFEAALHAGELPYTLADVRAELAGWNLACWCPDAVCHATVLLRVANEPQSRADQPTSRFLGGRNRITPADAHHTRDEAQAVAKRARAVRRERGTR